METLRVGKADLPFEDSAKVRELLKAAAVNLKHVKKGAKNEVKRFAFLVCKGSCANKKVDFAYRWEEFISLVDPNLDKKVNKLLSEMEKADKKEKGSQKNKAEEDASNGEGQAGTESDPEAGDGNKEK